MKLKPQSWIVNRLNRQFSVTIITGFIIIFIIYIIAFSSIYYYEQLSQERNKASIMVNRLLETFLEKALLKQDIDSLQEIVQKLGQQPDIHQVILSNAEGEIRFSSDPTLLATKISWSDDNTLPSQSLTLFKENDRNEIVLRTINPIHNKSQCTNCHGSIVANSTNGVLIVDYDAEPILKTARYNTLLFISASTFFILFFVVILWLLLRYFVLIPIQRLANASKILESGGVGVADTTKNYHITEVGLNELSLLADNINKMATNLQNSKRDICETEKFLQALLNAVPNGLRVIDKNYQVIKVNKAFCQQLGLSINSVLKQNCYESSYAKNTPCPPNMVTCPCYEIEKTNQPVKVITQHVCADGSLLDVEVLATPITVEIKGKTIKFLVEYVRDLNQAIQFTHEQKLATMTELASGIAHQIYNPLTSVRLALQSTLKSLDAGESDLARFSDYLKLVDGEIDKCVDVTQRLLKLCKPASEKLQLIAVNEAISETIKLLEFESLQHNIKIELILDAEQDRVLARENDIRMIILNIAQNAFHAMPQGGKLSIRTLQNNGKIYIIFTDTGYGIQAKHLPQIFDPFFSYRANQNKGAGLGLSICKILVKHYGGQIEVSSQWKQGCQFTVILPDEAAIVSIKEI